MGMKMPPDTTLKAIERHFHKLIQERAGKLIDEHSLALPELDAKLVGVESRTWFPIPGMYGGFSYWLEGEGDQTKLVTESWCRVVDGSGQRHEITAMGRRLVAEGFV